MRSVFYFVLTIPGLYGTLACESYGQVQVAQDSYRQARVVTVKLLHRSTEEINSFGATREIEAMYFRSQKTDGTAPVEVKLILEAKETSELKPEAFVQIDDVAYELKMSSINRSTNVSQHYSPILIGDRRTATDYKVFGTLVFSPTLWRKMMNGQTLSYRIYVDQTPYTIRVTSEAFAKLRQFDRL